MRFSTGSRHIREGFKNIFRNGWMTFASASAIAISLFILGVFLLLALNVNYLAKQIENQVEILVYMQVNTPQEQETVIKNQIGSMPEVSRVTFVSKEEGLKILRDKMGNDGNELLQGQEEDNPLPDMFKVEVTEPRDIASVAEAIKALNDGQNPGPVYKVNYGADTVNKLFSVTRIIRNVGLILVAGMAFTAMFLIANTIKLTIDARRREIAIMKLVGAANSFIRWPFFIEGALLGLIGSMIPTALLLYGYFKLVTSTQFQMGLMMVQLKPYNEITFTLTSLLLGIGIIIGIWGTTISIRKYLKV